MQLTVHYFKQYNNIFHTFKIKFQIVTGFSKILDVNKLSKANTSKNSRYFQKDCKTY